MENLFENLPIWQMIGVGCLLGVIYLLIFRWKVLIRLFHEEKQKYPSPRGAKAQIQKTPAKPVDGAVAVRIIEGCMTAAYRGWHRLPNIIRLFLCWPACIAFVAAFFFCTIWPTFLGALSFGASKSVLQELNMIPIFSMHLSIYLFMSRGRFILSGLLAVSFLIFAIVTFFQLPPGADFWDVTCRGFYQCIAAFCLAWAWIKSISNRPAALFHLAGGLMIASGILNAILSLLMLFWVPSMIDNTITNKLLTLPVYYSFEPFLTRLMTPLHLQSDDFISVNVILAVVILSWGGLLFCLGGFMCLAKYDIISTTPENVENLRMA